MTPLAGPYVGVVGHARAVADGLATLGTPTRLVTGPGVADHDALLAGASLLVVDAALEPDDLVTVLALAEGAGVRVVLEPSDPAVARAVVLGPHPVHTVVADPDVLAALTGLATTTDDEVDDAVGAVLARGVEVVWLRRGGSGSLLARAGARGTTSLAGDPGTAAYCHALLAGADPLEAASAPAP